MSPTPFNAFPGLRPFDRDENDRFFGRESHVDELLRRLSGHRFVAVIGESGSGKSSLVRAGLLPALEGGFMVRAGSGWRIAVARPGSDPLGQLAVALAEPEIFGSIGSQRADAFDRELETDMIAATLKRSRHGLVQAVREARMDPGENLLVVIDQFEELFRYRDRLQDRLSDEATTFVRLLLTAADEPEMPLYVVLTMRSDFLGDCAQFPGLPEAINDSQYLVPRLTRRQLERAIRGPVGVGGGSLARPLLQRLLNDLSDDPDQLPILQHALMRTVDRWLTEGAEGAIGLDHYRAIGGMQEALSRHADEAWEELAEEDRPLAESVFKNLTELGAGGRGVRRPTRLDRLAEIAGTDLDAVCRVLEPFRRAGRTFLTPSLEDHPRLEPEQMIDISHESLMRAWGRLSEWADEEAESVRFYRRLAETAALYPYAAGLWRQPELGLAERWRQASRPTAAWAERHGGRFEASMNFLQASGEAWQAERLAARERNRRESSKRLAFQSERVLARDHELALLLAHAAGRQAPTDEAERALRAVLDHRGRSFALLRGHAARVVDVRAAVTSEGPALASADQDGGVVIWDLENQRPACSFTAHAASVTLAWSGDGRRLATLGAEGLVKVWDPTTGELLHRLEGHQAGVAAAVWHPDGRRLATASLDFTGRVWDTDTGASLARLQGHTDWISAIRWVGQGELVTASGDATLRLWDAATGETRQILAGHVDKVRALAVSPSGDLVASGGNDTTVGLWDVASGREIARFREHRDWVVDLAWSAGGDRLASASRDGMVRLWAPDRPDGSLAVLTGHVHQVSSVVWSSAAASQEQLLTAGVDGTARVWTPSRPELPPTVLTGHRGPVEVARWGGHRARDPAVVTGGADGTVRLWDPGPGYQRIPRIEPDRMPEFQGVAWSPDGERIATAHRDGAVRLWDRATGELTESLTLVPQHPGTAPALVGCRWSPDGGGILAGSRDHQAVYWDLASGGTHLFDAHRTGVQHGAFTPVGDRVATGSFDGVVHVWEPRNPSVRGAPVEHGGGITALEWHRGGQRLLTAGDDGTLVIWETGDSPFEPRRLHTLEGHLSVVLGACWSPDGRRVASVGVDQTVRLWDAVAGKPQRTLVGHQSWTLRLAWSPDGRQLASAGRDGAVILWRPDRDDDTGQSLLGHRAAVSRLAFSTDGGQLLTACQDGGVRLWHSGLDDPLRGEEIVLLARHSQGVLDAAWSPDGRRILTASFDRTVRVYRAHLDDLVAEAEERAVRGPTTEEAELYGLEPWPSGDGREAASPPTGPAAAEASVRPTPEELRSRPLRFGAVLFSENEWAQEVHRGIVDGAERARRELGVELEMEIGHHEFELAREIELVDRFLERPVDALLVTPRDLQASVPSIRRAHEQGVLVAAMGTSLNLADAERYVASAYESDQFELGYRTGYYLSQWLVDRGWYDDTLELGIVQCERFEQCYERGRGFRAALLYTGVRWREVSNVEGLVLDEAQRRAEEMLREHPRITVIFTQHDASTRGAVQAVRNLDLAGQVFVFGTDMAESIAQMLVATDDVLQATTGQQARRMGAEAVLDAARQLLGHDTGPRQKVLASPVYTREPWHRDALRSWIEPGGTR